MLKITRLARKGRTRTLKLEGEILGPWVQTVRDACTQREGPPGPLCLDLAAVTFVDAAGARLLHDLMCEGIEIAACSSYVIALLHLEES